MNYKVKRFFEDLKGKTVAFAGISRSNIPLLAMFRDQGIKVIACDAHDSPEMREKARSLEESGVEVVLDQDFFRKINADVIFRTPGVNFLLSEIEEKRAEGVVVTSEMEVFFDLCPCRVFAVTGSDGKTTTTTIIARMLESAGKVVHLGGNIGTPLLQDINKVTPEDVAVVELSSFQLISMRKSPDVAVVTNLFPNHLDVHKDMDEYVQAKQNILLHQNAFSRTVLNLDNKSTRELEGFVRGDKLMFTRQDMSREDCFRGVFVGNDNVIYVKTSIGIITVMDKSAIKIPGEHNVENFLAAIAAVWGYVGVQDIQNVAHNFTGIEHRIEFVREINGVKFYNDSIASSPTRTIKGMLSLYDEKIILICGGYDKKISFNELGAEIVKKVKVLVLIGQTAPMIEEATRLNMRHGEGPVILRAENMDQAVQMAYANALDGDVISLSPACASFGLYKDFAERGNHFKEIVMKM